MGEGASSALRETLAPPCPGLRWGLGSRVFGGDCPGPAWQKCLSRERSDFTVGLKPPVFVPTRTIHSCVLLPLFRCFPAG